MHQKNFNGVKIPDSLNKRNVNEKKEIYLSLTNSILLQQDENYDCTKENVWSYRQAKDIMDGIPLKFGNMVKGFPFDLSGNVFLNSEAAYIAGAYANNDETSIKIQQEISKERNGWLCKKIYRNNRDYVVNMRSDFYAYNVEWMMYVVWEKCKNSDFAELLKQVPVDAHIVENTSLHKGNTAVFWGAKNKELTEKRLEKTKEVEQQQNFRFKKDLRQAQNIASNEINNIGTFIGQNVMGKIIKLCSLALIFNQEPKINYDVLANANLYLMGKKLF